MSGNAEVVSWSKDSIYIRWTFDDDRVNSTFAGYQIQYQAVGSNVQQRSSLLDISTSAYDITHLHENTNYKICVLRMREPISSAVKSSTSEMLEAKACVNGSTSTDSLSVALGSTFGAFLALGLIVALVFVAKWQHSRRAKKQQQAAEVAGNGATAKAEFDIDDVDDVLRVEIAEEIDTIPGEYVALSTTAMTTYSSSTLPPPAWTSSHITSAAVDVTLDDQQLQLQHQPLPRGTLTDDDTAAVDMHTARPDTLSDHRHTDTATGSS